MAYALRFWALRHKFAPVAASNTVKAFCYLEQVNDEQNKISLTDSRMVMKYRNKIDSYELPTIKDVTFGHRKAMLYLISGGIAVPFTAVAFYRDFLNPWPTLFLLFGGVFAIYLGWRGYQVLTIHLFGFDRDYRLTSVSDNMMAFVSFALKFLPINLPLTDSSEPLIYHLTDVSTWNQTKTETNFHGDTKDGFIHASTREQIESTREKYFKGRKHLLLVTINPMKVNAEIRYEDLLGQGQLYPHIYGVLNLDAVVKIEELN